MADERSYPGMPRWAKVSGVVAGVLVLLAVVVIVTGIGGPHGPGRHAPSGATEEAVPPGESRP